jgi:hypothetical protein
MSGVLEQVIIVVFSLHLREPLALDLAMLSFISLPYTVLHHDFQFFCLIAFISGLVIIDVMTGCFGFSFFLGIFMFFFIISWIHGDSMFLEIPLLFIIGSRIWMDNQEYFKAFLRKGLLLRLS